MPTPHLTAPEPVRTADAVRAVLTGHDIAAVASNVGVTPLDLADAADAYHLGGIIALENRAAGHWQQARVRPASPATAEHILSTVIGPRLDNLVAGGSASGWWFMRKEPGWRIRLRDADTQAAERHFNDLAADGIIAAWNPAIYEPETAAFGGDTGTDITHDLFEADTSGLLTYLRHESPPFGRKEMSLLLISSMLAAAGLDWFERGDVFSRVTAMRQPPSLGPAALADLTEQLCKLLAVTTAGEPLSFTRKTPVAAWQTAFEEAGDRYAAAASAGTLTRGLRAVLAHIVIFHWNRLGLPASAQAALARAAACACIPLD